MKFANLSDYVSYLLSRSDWIFTKQEAFQALKGSDAALRNSIKRQVASGKMLRLLKGIYLIIPPEFKNMGFVPPELFIDDLMKKAAIDYYVGLLSAASFYGATHQAAQIFQVMVKRPLKPLKLGSTRVVFYVNKKLQKIPTHKIKTDRGKLNVSSAEATSLDLIRYVSQSGHLNHIATVLREMSEKIDADKLEEILDQYPLVALQRLGYLFEILNEGHLRNRVEKYVRAKKPQVYSPLTPSKMSSSFEKSPTWHLIINEHVEPDL